MSIPKFLELPEFGSLKKIDDLLAINKKFRFQNKFIFFFTLLSFTVSIIIISVIYQSSSNSRLAELKTQLTRLTESVSICFNGDTHQNLINESDELNELRANNTDEVKFKAKADKIKTYHEIVYSKLSRFQKTFNITEKQRIISVFTLFKRAGQTDIFIGTSTEYPEKRLKFNFDTVYTSKKQNESNILALKQAFLGKPGTDTYISLTKSGTTLSGYSPMYDAHNNIVGVIGIDIDASGIRVLKWSFIFYTLFALVLSFVLSLILAMFLTERISRPLKSMIESTREISNGNFNLKTSLKNKYFSDLEYSISLMSKSLLERDWKNRILKPYVSEETEHKILKNVDLFNTQPMHKIGTVLNVEIQDFASIIDNRTPEEVISFLNEYTKTVRDIIFNYAGCFVGIDITRITAVFGIPYETDFHAENAVKCALSIQEKVNEASTKSIKNMWSSVKLSIGIDSDKTISGYTGDEKASRIALAGKAVDFSSQLLAKNEELETCILISISTYKMIQLERETHSTVDDDEKEISDMNPEELCNFEITGEFYVNIKDSEDQTKVYAIER